MPTLLLAAALTLAAPDAGWQAGFAAVKITPERPVWMAGYAARTAPAAGTETDLYARAAAFADPAGKRFVLVALDLVGIDRDLSQLVARRIREKHGLPREAVALTVTHTHCGPVVGTTLRSMYFLDAGQAERVREYTTALPAKVLAAVDAAVADLRPVTLHFAEGTASFAVNRRANKEAEVPKLRAAGTPLQGPTDHRVPVLAARGPDGKLRGVVFGYACHATTLDFLKWCGDYPGYAVAELEAANPGAVAVFVAGCGADQNPLPRRTVELAKGYGRQLAAAVTDVLGEPTPSVKGKWSGRYAEIDLPFAKVPTRDELQADLRDKNKYVAARAKDLLAGVDGGQPVPASYPYPVQVWKLGDRVTWALLGGEVVVDYSLRLSRDLGPGPVWVSGYANDVMAYIPSERVLAEGGYEGGGAMVYYGRPGPWAAGIERRITDSLTRMR
ncbi:MAG: neutral/alkaline non-lysosomal ceramidase N-terminal domain-containing protein [Gemmataceae bacterium]